MRTSEALTSLMNLKPTVATLLTFRERLPSEEEPASASASASDSKSDAPTPNPKAKSKYATVSAADAAFYVPSNIEAEVEVDANSLQPGDVVKVLRGTKIPSDGVVVWGSGSVDESMLTGESMPVIKGKAGDAVIGSTVLGEGLLHVRVTTTGEQSTLAQILSLMEDAVASKAPIQAFADQVCVLLCVRLWLCCVALLLQRFFSRPHLRCAVLYCAVLRCV